MTSSRVSEPAPLTQTSFIFDPRPDYPYRLAVNRYQHRAHASTDEDALTLIFVHCHGAHKELWEPTLEHIFELANHRPDLKIREAWCIDSPEQGDSAILNDGLFSSALNWRSDAPLTGFNYAESVHRFLSGLGTGVEVDFRSRRLVGIGHSFGGAAVVQSTRYEPKVNFHSVILLDPIILRMPEPGDPDLKWSEGVSMLADTWESRDEASRYLLSLRQWKSWDRRVFEKYIEHGLRDLPSPSYPGRTHGVALKCPRRVEAAIYRDTLFTLGAFDYLHALCERIPVHLVHPEHANLVPRPFMNDVSRVAARGLHTSIRTIPGVGHMVVQTHPDRAASAIVAALEHEITSQPSAGAGTLPVARL